jgi:hypothetical protein
MELGFGLGLGFGFETGLRVWFMVRFRVRFKVKLKRYARDSVYCRVVVYRAGGLAWGSV